MLPKSRILAKYTFLIPSETHRRKGLKFKRVVLESRAFPLYVRPGKEGFSSPGLKLEWTFAFLFSCFLFESRHLNLDRQAAQPPFSVAVSVPGWSAHDPLQRGRCLLWNNSSHCPGDKGGAARVSPLLILKRRKSTLDTSRNALK